MCRQGPVQLAAGRAAGPEGPAVPAQLYLERLRRPDALREGVLRPADLFTPVRPVRAKGTDKSSTYVGPEGVCVNSLVGEGCRIEGVVENSILFPGVNVAKGAAVRDSILFNGTNILSGAKLAYVICDKDVKVQEDRTLMGHATYPIVVAKGSIV